MIKNITLEVAKNNVIKTSNEKITEKYSSTLTPNTNCFGHMAYWLNQNELKHLALKPEGFEFSKHGTRGYAQTIDPDSEEAYEFVIKLLDELLICFPECKRMTIGGDEPFELLFPVKDPNTHLPVKPWIHSFQ